MPLTDFSVFSGIGGIEVAAEAAGFRTAGFVENAAFQKAVLKKHWPGVPIWEDIHDVTADDVRERTGIERFTLITGGFPCQPFSQNGKRLGKEDDRYLWPEMLRIITGLRPAWVVGENVAGIRGLALDTCLTDLESRDYTCRAFSIPAYAVQAPHQRIRIFIIAHDNSAPPRSSKTMADPASLGVQGMRTEGIQESQSLAEPVLSDGLRIGHWETESGLVRMADGLRGGMDKRIHALGNAVVPQQVYPILKAIADIEKGRIT